MFKLYLLLFLLAHIIGDFYFQTSAVADAKKSSLRFCALHIVLYAAACILVIIPVFSISLLIGMILLGASHAAIDLVKYALEMNLPAARPRGIKVTIPPCGAKGEQESAASRAVLYPFGSLKKIPAVSGRIGFLIDQLIHILCAAAAAFYFAAAAKPVLLPFAREFFRVTQIDPSAVLPWALMCLLVWKPANVMIKQLIADHKPPQIQENTEDSAPAIIPDTDKRPNAGAFIGLLERLIILLLITIGQFSAIGLVLTAKSIARYNLISTDKEFAEYYLLGTLLSTGFVIVSWYIILR